MEWLALSCAVAGFFVGFVIYSAAGILLSSVQVLIYMLGFWATADLAWYELFLWSAVGLSAHQAAYLLGVIVKSSFKAPVQIHSRLATKVDADLGEMFKLAENIEHRAPEVSREVADLSRLLAEMRRRLGDKECLERLLSERKAAS